MTTPLNLDHIRIYCTDLSECHTFYSQTLGLKVLEYRPARQFAMYLAGTCRLVLQAVEDKKLTGRITGISLSTPDIETAFHQLSSVGVEFSSMPVSQFWGGKTVEFKDPAGNVLTLAGYQRPF